MAKKRIIYRVTLPNELPLEGLMRARYSSMETRDLFTKNNSPERAVRSVVRRQNTDNRFYAITILEALKLHSKGNIGMYAVPLNTDTGNQSISKSLDRVVADNLQEDKQLMLF